MKRRLWLKMMRGHKYVRGRNPTRAEYHPDKFCPRCGMRFTPANPNVDGTCQWCHEPLVGNPLKDGGYNIQV